MKTKKVSKPTLDGDAYLISQAVNNNAEVLENALSRIKELEKRLKREQEPFKNAYIQAAKERDIAIGQLNELGYSLGEKIRPCDKESENKECRGCRYNDGEVHAECVVCNNDKSKDEKKKENIIAKIEIEAQEKWLMQAGYNALNVSIAFDSIKRALGL